MARHTIHYSPQPGLLQNGSPQHEQPQNGSAATACFFRRRHRVRHALAHTDRNGPWPAARAQAPASSAVRRLTAVTRRLSTAVALPRSTARCNAVQPYVAACCKHVSVLQRVATRTCWQHVLQRGATLVPRRYELAVQNLSVLLYPAATVPVAVVSQDCGYASKIVLFRYRRVPVSAAQCAEGPPSVPSMALVYSAYRLARSASPAAPCRPHRRLYPALHGDPTRHGIPHGTVSLAARYPSRHGRCCAGTSTAKASMGSSAGATPTKTTTSTTTSRSAPPHRPPSLPPSCLARRRAEVSMRGCRRFRMTSRRVSSQALALELRS